MGYSKDLRVRVIHIVEGGAAARAAARQFVIGDVTAIRMSSRCPSSQMNAPTTSATPDMRHGRWKML
jgi:hypothetical protein